MKFKIGDKVVIKESCSGTTVGDEHVLKDNVNSLWAGDCDCPSRWELVTKRKTIMQKLTPMLKRALSKEWQTLYKAGFVNGDLEFTEEGESALASVLLDQYKEQLVQLAQESLDEEEKERKK